MFGRTLRAPAAKARKLVRTGGSSVPPITPRTPLLLTEAAAMPARKDGSSNAKESGAMFGPTPGAAGGGVHGLRVLRGHALRGVLELEAVADDEREALGPVLPEVLVELRRRLGLDMADLGPEGVPDPEEPIDRQRSSRPGRRSAPGSAGRPETQRSQGFPSRAPRRRRLRVPVCG